MNYTIGFQYLLFIARNWFSKQIKISEHVFAKSLIFKTAGENERNLIFTGDTHNIIRLWMEYAIGPTKIVNTSTVSHLYLTFLRSLTTIKNFETSRKLKSISIYCLFSVNKFDLKRSQDMCFKNGDNVGVKSFI